MGKHLAVKFPAGNLWSEQTRKLQNRRQVGDEEEQSWEGCSWVRSSGRAEGLCGHPPIQ